MIILKGWKKYFGLMFTPKKYAKPVTFEWDKEVLVPIHMWFVFFPCKLIWKDSDDNVVEERIVHPWEKNIKPARPFKTIIEIPLLNLK